MLNSGGDIGPRALLPFFLLAFGLAWGIVALLILFPAQVVALAGPVSGTNPLFILAVYAPAIAAFVLVLMHGGPRALGRYLTRLGLWRAPPMWYVFVLLGIPVLFFAGAWLKGDMTPGAVTFEGFGALLGALGLTLIIGPVEELGWRGFALPLLQRRMAPVWAALVLGALWGLWHLPAFYLSGTPQSAWGFAPFFVASVAVSVIVTALFNDAGGSILLSALFHFQLNNPVWPDAQPHDTWMFLAAAVVVLWVRRHDMFYRHAARTAVIP